jgi:hypothetical protein
MLGFHRVKFEVRKYFIGEGAYFTVNKISSQRYKKPRIMAGSFQDLTVYTYGEKSREVSSNTVKRKYRNIANCFLPTAKLRFAT